MNQDVVPSTRYLMNKLAKTPSDAESKTVIVFKQVTVSKMFLNPLLYQSLLRFSILSFI